MVRRLIALYAIAVAPVLAGPGDVPVIFVSTNMGTVVGESVFVGGLLPQLGSWDQTRAIKMVVDGSSCIGTICSWSVTIALPENANYQYKFIRRNDCATCYADATNFFWEPGADRQASTPAGPPAPYTGKTIFYFGTSSWSSVSLLYSNTVSGWTAQPMTLAGVGRTNLFTGEKLWRVDGINKAGETNLTFVFTDNNNHYDNPDGVAGRNYETPLDACVVQDGNVYNYWPAGAVGTNRVILIPANVSFNPTNGLATRSLRVYLPRGYDQNTSKRYPVLYMHDGQNIFIAQYAGSFGCWYADTNANNLIRFGKMREAIIVGVDNDDRFCEYSPPGCTSLCPLPKGSQYVSWIANKVRPYINANFRTLTDAENTGALGSSLGGLISAYMAWDWSNVFSKLGCFSSSFQVCTPFAAPPASKRPVRVYLDSGDSGTSNDNVLLTATERDRLVSLGYVFNMDLDHVIGFGDQHNEDAWKRRLPRALMFLFPTTDEPNTVLDSVAPMNIVGFQPGGESNIVTWTSYLKRTYTIQGLTNETLPSSVNWSNIVTTAPELRFWSYPSLGVSNNFHFIRIRQDTVPNWPN